MRYLRIVDPHGNRIPASALSGGGYEAAGTGRRLGYWGISSGGPNTVLRGSLQTVRARVRELTRNNPVAGSGLETWVSNLIGTGLTPRWKIGDQDLKARIQELWADWVLEADSYGTTDFYGLQALVSRALIESGEVLVRFRPRYPSDGLSVPLQLQLLECDHLDEDYETILENGHQVRMGIEFDRIMRRAAYWVLTEHPGEQWPFFGRSERVRVPASEILHIFRPLRPGQMRGAPWLTTIILRLHELDQYEDAELVRKKTAAMFGGFITEKEPGEEIGLSPLGKRQEADSEGREVVALEPGTFPVLPPGMDVKFSEPSDVGGTYEVWMKQQLREIAAGIGVTYEQLTGDLSDVNYSSIRAGLLEFRRRCEMLQQQTIVFQFCKPVADRWLDSVWLSRALDLPDYLRDRRAYRRVEWRPQGWRWVDPLKDIMAEQLAVRSGFKSRSAVIAEQGYDREVVDRQIAEDNASADALGLIFDSDPRKTAKSGAAQRAEDRLADQAAVE